MSSIKTAAFAFMAPDALRVFLQIAGYRVSVFTGAPETLDLRQDKPEADIVILPNFAKRNMLERHADSIGYLVVMTGGKHEDLIDLDIPILDATMSGDTLHQTRDRSPHFYTKKIKEAAVVLELAAVPQVPTTAPAVAAPPKVPETLDQWFDKLDDEFTKDGDFAQAVEYPVCQYLVGQLGRKSLQSAMKVLAKQCLHGAVVQTFYKWLVKRAGKMVPAMKQYLLPSSEASTLTAQEAAKKFKIPERDIELLESIYSEMQPPAEGEPVDE